MRFLPMVFSSTRPCWMRKSRYSFRTLQFTFALYMMWVSLRGPLWARTLRMSTYISNFDLRMGMPLYVIVYFSFYSIYIIYGFRLRFLGFILVKGVFLFGFFGILLGGFGVL